MTVRYTPSQLREAVLLPQETYRHWKKVLPPLCRDTRQSPCFTAGDLLAVSIVRTLTRSSIPVGALTTIAEELFRICNATSWPVLERSTLLLDLPRQRLELQPESEALTFPTLTLVCPLQPLVGHLRNVLLADGSPDQQRLHFPPVPVSPKAAAASTGGGS